MFVKSLLSGTDAIYHMLYLKRNQWKSSQELKKIQWKKLKAMIQYANDYIPYYNRLFKSVKFKPDDLRSIKDLKKIPTTTKKNLRDNYLNFFAKGIDVSKLITSYTSGSTGIPIKILRDQKELSYSVALMAYATMECGLRLRDKFVKIGRFHSFNYLPNQISIPSPAESEELEVTISLLNKIKPVAIYASAWVISNLCTADAAGIEPRLIFSHGSTLTEHTRDLVKTTFGIDVNNTYGSTEFNRLAFECNKHSGMHIMTDGAVMESLNDEEQVSLGETGEVVVTGLYNFSMPLIRYKLDDLVVFTDERCSCGRNWPLIKSVEGKTRDILTLESGRKIYPSFLYRCLRDERNKNIFIISEFQFVQEKKNKIVLKIVKGKKFNKNIIISIIKKLENKFKKINENIDVELQIVDEIPIEKSGKKRIIISLKE